MAEDAQEQRFLDAIRADPTALGPRLVFADWLQQKGDPLGEFIALMIAIEKEPRDPALLQRRDELRPVFNTWQHFRSYAVKRGLPDELRLESGQIPADLASKLERTAFSRLEINRGLSEADLPHFEAALAKMCVRQLCIKGVVLGATLRSFLDYRGMDRLESLTLDADTHFYGERTADHDDNLLAYLVHADLRRLGELAVDNGASSTRWITDQGAESLTIKKLPRVTKLSLRRHKIGPKGVARLLQLPLTSLDLSGNFLGEDGARAIVESHQCVHLESIALARTTMNREALRILAHAKHLQKLKVLTLADDWLPSDIALEDLEELVASPFLSLKLRVEIDGLCLGLDSHVYMDMGLAVDSEWRGDIPKFLTNRFPNTVLVGRPPL